MVGLRVAEKVLDVVDKRDVGLRAGRPLRLDVGDGLARVRVARLALRGDALIARDEELPGAGVDRGLEDGGGAVEQHGHGGEDDQVGGGVGPVEAVLLGAGELVVPAVDVEQVEDTDEEVESRKKQRDGDLRDADQEEVDANVDEDREHPALHEHLQDLQRGRQDLPQRVHNEREARRQHLEQDASADVAHHGAERDGQHGEVAQRLGESIDAEGGRHEAAAERRQPARRARAKGEVAVGDGVEKAAAGVVVGLVDVGLSVRGGLELLGVEAVATCDEAHAVGRGLSGRLEPAGFSPSGCGASTHHTTRPPRRSRRSRARCTCTSR